MEHGPGLISLSKTGGQGFFLKANSSLSGPEDPVVLPDLPNREVHHECEQAIIIGKRGRHIPREAVDDYIFGYSCLIDAVVRGKEERVMRKSFDSFCPVGPYITTRDEVVDYSNISMELCVNGEVRQQANTRNLIVDIPEMIALSSSVMTFEPGDIIATGTPAGVGLMSPGDKVTISVTGIGTMTLDVVKEQIPAHKLWENRVG
jgi:2-keto-4-pentenoate hydratase/2-oxohepta-3-ene-1,7-dioic acid hydratase in catechol pathway